MRICPKCNHKNKDTSKFCEECGSKLIEALSILEGFLVYPLSTLSTPGAF